MHFCLYASLFVADTLIQDQMYIFCVLVMCNINRKWLYLCMNTYITSKGHRNVLLISKKYVCLNSTWEVWCLTHPRLILFRYLCTQIASLYSFRKGHGLDIYYNKWGCIDDVFHVCGLFVPCLIGKYMFVILHACHLSMYSWIFYITKNWENIC